MQSNKLFSNNNFKGSKRASECCLWEKVVVEKDFLCPIWPEDRRTWIYLNCRRVTVKGSRLIDWWFRNFFPPPILFALIVYSFLNEFCSILVVLDDAHTFLRVPQKFLNFCIFTVIHDGVGDLLYIYCIFKMNGHSLLNSFRLLLRFTTSLFLFNNIWTP